MAGAAEADAPGVAKTDSNFSSAVDWQLGHWGTVSERTSASNWWLQLLQAYSYIGIFLLQVLGRIIGPGKCLRLGGLDARRRRVRDAVAAN